MTDPAPAPGIPATPRLQATVAKIVRLVSAIVLFARLGQYALWDDEAITALTANGVWQTGDTSAVVGHNVVAYRNGLLIRDMKDRATPPLQFYLAAPFVGLLGDTSFAARLPFAACGFATVALILWWAHRARASAATWLLLGIAIVGNVSLFLFSRQCRYYGLAMLLSVAVAYTYLHARTRRGLVFNSLLWVLLLAANYMTFAAVASMVLVDYTIWGRTRRPLRGWDWVILVSPVAVVGAVVVWIWNPLRIAEPRAEDFNWLAWHAKLLWWNLRDLNACEFGSGALLLAAPVIAVLARSVWLTRAVVALAVGIFVISVVSPQNPSNTHVADVRYLSFLIPLCIAVGVLTLLPLAHLSLGLTVVIACVAFGSNLLNFSPLTEAPLRSTPYAYARELVSPVPEPFTPVAEWIHANVKPGESVLVVPPYATYPLMFHAPHAVYAWQLSDPPPPGLAHLPPVHVALRVPPDVIIAFGPGLNMLENVRIRSGEDVQLRLEKRIDVLWKDRYRPELFWRSFTPEKFNPATKGVFILRRVPPQPSFRL